MDESKGILIMFYLNELVNDLIANRYLYNLDKYSRKIPQDLKISSIMDYIHENNLFEKFVEKEYVSGRSYGTPIFLILNEDKKYEFFTLERPGWEMGMMYFDLIEDGVRKKIEYFLYEFGHNAPDAIY